MTRSPLKSLLRSLRRRLWLERGLLRFQAAAWAGSLTLLALSCYSAFLSPLPSLHAVAVALAVALVVAASAVFLRPPLQVCARRADRLFDTSSLLLTALEVGRKGEDSAAGRVVAQQANSAAPLLRGKIGNAWTAPPPSGFALILVPLFAATLLLSYATAENGAAAAPGEAPASLHAIEYELEDDEDLVALRDTMVDGPLERESRSSDSIGAEGPAIGETPEALLAGSSATVATTAVPGDGRDAGDSAPDPGAAALELDPPDTASLTAVSLSRRGDAVGAEAGGEFAPTEAVAAITNVVPAAAPASLSDWSALSPAQVAYARRYLDRMEAGND